MLIAKFAKLETAQVQIRKIEKQPKYKLAKLQGAELQIHKIAKSWRANSQNWNEHLQNRKIATRADVQIGKFVSIWHAKSENCVAVWLIHFAKLANLRKIGMNFVIFLW
jgi:hypothetical protein